MYVWNGNYRAAAIAAVSIAAVTGVFLGGWYVNGWRWSGKYEKLKGLHQEALLEAIAERDKAAAHIVEVTGKHQQALERIRHANKMLMDNVARDSVRLRVKANCVSTAAASPGVGNGRTAELDTAARQDYYALRDGIALVETQLKACQSAIRAVRE